MDEIDAQAWVTKQQPVRLVGTRERPPRTGPRPDMAKIDGIITDIDEYEAQP